MMRILPVVLLVLAAPAWGQSRFADPVIADCETAGVRLRMLSAADVLAVCEHMQRRLQPPLRASQLRDLATAVGNLAGNGWMASPSEIGRQVVAVIALRGQGDQPRQWRATAELLVEIHAASDAHVTPAHLSAALAEAGPAAQLLDDEGLRQMAATIRERQRRGG